MLRVFDEQGDVLKEALAKAAAEDAASPSKVQRAGLHLDNQPDDSFSAAADVLGLRSSPSDGHRTPERSESNAGSDSSDDDSDDESDIEYDVSKPNIASSHDATAFSKAANGDFDSQAQHSQTTSKHADRTSYEGLQLLDRGYELLNNRWATSVLLTLTVYVLFGNDARLVTAPKEADGTFQILSSICFFSFILELLVRSLCESQFYFVRIVDDDSSTTVPLDTQQVDRTTAGNGSSVDGVVESLKESGNDRDASVRPSSVSAPASARSDDDLERQSWWDTITTRLCCGRRYKLVRRGYFLSFLFFLDALAIISMIPEIDFLWNAVLSGGASSNNLSTVRASRISRLGSRVGRIIRMVRLVRLFKLYSFWKRLSSKHAHGSSSLLQQIIETGGMRESQLAHRLQHSITSRVIFMVLVMLLLVPVFVHKADDDTEDYASNAIDTINQWRGPGWDVSVRTLLDRYATYQADDGQLDEDTGQPRLLKMLLTPADGVPADLFLDRADVYNNLRVDSLSDEEVVQYDFVTPNAMLANGSIVEVRTTVWWNDKPAIRNASLHTIYLTLLIIIFLGVGALQLASDAQALVLRPIENMIAFVERMALDPLSDISSRDNTGSFETKVLENTIKKVTGVLRVGFGASGALIVAKHLDARAAITPADDYPTPSTPLLASGEVAVNNDSLNGLNILKTSRSAPGGALNLIHTPRKESLDRQHTNASSFNGGGGSATGISGDRSPTPGYLATVLGFMGTDSHATQNSVNNSSSNSLAARNQESLASRASGSRTESVAISHGSSIHGTVSAEFAGSSLRRRDQGIFNPYVPGRTVRAIFVRVGLPHCDEMADVLGENYIPHFNRIAKLVHDTCLAWGGAPVSNDCGSGFTLVWVVDDAWDALMDDQDTAAYVLGGQEAAPHVQQRARRGSLLANVSNRNGLLVGHNLKRNTSTGSDSSGGQHHGSSSAGAGSDAAVGGSSASSNAGATGGSSTPGGLARAVSSVAHARRGSIHAQRAVSLGVAITGLAQRPVPRSTTSMSSDDGHNNGAGENGAGIGASADPVQAMLNRSQALVGRQTANRRRSLTMSAGPGAAAGLRIPSSGKMSTGATATPKGSPPRSPSASIIHAGLGALDAGAGGIRASGRLVAARRSSIASHNRGESAPAAPAHSRRSSKLAGAVAAGATAPDHIGIELASLPAPGTSAAAAASAIYASFTSTPEEGRSIDASTASQQQQHDGGGGDNISATLARRASFGAGSGPASPTSPVKARLELSPMNIHSEQQQQPPLTEADRARELLVEAASEVAERALVACLKTFVALKRSKDINESKEVASLRESALLRGYRPSLSFGIHVGWAVECALGSIRKVDVAYLSPHLNTTTTIQQLAPHYHAPVLMSGPFARLLGPKVRGLCRRIDVVELPSDPRALEEPVSSKASTASPRVLRAAPSTAPVSLFVYDAWDWSASIPPSLLRQKVTQALPSLPFGSEFRQGAGGGAQRFGGREHHDGVAADGADAAGGRTGGAHGRRLDLMSPQAVQVPIESLAAVPPSLLAFDAFSRNLQGHDVFNVHRSAISERERCISIVGAADIIEHPVQMGEYSGDIWNQDPDLLALRAPFTDAFRAAHAKAVSAYVGGNWSAAGQALMSVAATLAEARHVASGASNAPVAGAPMASIAEVVTGTDGSVDVTDVPAADSQSAASPAPATPVISTFASTYVFRLSDLDYPSRALYEHMASHRFTAPAGWRGARTVDHLVEGHW